MRGKPWVRCAIAIVQQVAELRKKQKVQDSFVLSVILI